MSKMRHEVSGSITKEYLYWDLHIGMYVPAKITNHEKFLRGHIYVLSLMIFLIFVVAILIG